EGKVMLIAEQCIGFRFPILVHRIPEMISRRRCLASLDQLLQLPRDVEILFGIRTQLLITAGAATTASRPRAWRRRRLRLQPRIVGVRFIDITRRVGNVCRWISYAADDLSVMRTITSSDRYCTTYCDTT